MEGLRGGGVLANTGMLVWTADTRRGKTEFFMWKARLGGSDASATPLSLALCCGSVSSPPRRDACYLVTSEVAHSPGSTCYRRVSHIRVSVWSSGSHQTHALADVHSRPLQLMGGARGGHPHEPHDAAWLYLTRTPP